MLALMYGFSNCTCTLNHLYRVLLSTIALPVMATKRLRGPPTGQTPKKPPKVPRKASKFKENAEGSGWTTSKIHL